jgi:phytoene dehydrogenase-like protein
MRAALTWLAAQSATRLTKSAPEIFWVAFDDAHEWRQAPEGGSGMLTQAMSRSFTASGGTVVLDAAVKRILIKGNRVEGVETVDGMRYTAPIVVSNAHIQTTMLGMVGSEHLSTDLAHKIRNIRVGNGFGMTVRCAADELPDYIAAPSGGKAHPSHHGLQLLSPSMDYVRPALPIIVWVCPPKTRP